MATRGNPTKKEQAWMDWIVRHGCAICRSPALVHHMLQGGRRMDHLHTIPLCYQHHQSGRDDEIATSRHPWKSRWEQRYHTTEREILTRLRREYARLCKAAIQEGD